MRLLATAVLSLVALGCSRRPAPVTAPATSVLEPAEAEVLRVVADSVYLRTLDHTVAVISRTVDTVCTVPTSGCASARARFGLDPVWWAEGDTITALFMRDDLLRRSAVPVQLDETLAPDDRLPPATTHEIGEILSGSNGWPAFRSRYGAVGYLRFSRVGFSPDRRRALVYVEWECGPTCGHHLAVSLRREDEGAWGISDALLLSSRRGGR